MNAKITLLVEGEDVDRDAATQALEEVAAEAHPVGETRGIGTAAQKALKWILEFTGGSAEVADALIGQATKQFAGATVKLQVGDTMVEVSNVNRSQVIDALEHAAEAARRAASL